MIYLKFGGKIKKCPTGFSWTTLFFGPFVPLFRGWYPMVLFHFGGCLLTFGVFGLFVPIEINKFWIKHLLEKGYRPVSSADEKALDEMGLTAYMKKWGEFPCYAREAGSGSVLYLDSIYPSFDARDEFRAGDQIQVEGSGFVKIASVDSGDRLTLESSATWKKGVRVEYPWDDLPLQKQVPEHKYYQPVAS